MKAIAAEQVELALRESITGLRCRRCGEGFRRQHRLAEHAATCLETAGHSSSPAKQPWRRAQTHIRHTQFMGAETVRHAGMARGLVQTTFKFADGVAFTARMQCAWFKACVPPGSVATQSTCACGAEGEGGCGAAGCAVTVVFTRPARPPPTRGSGRRRGQDAGFTPTVQILRLLLPIYRANNTGSGASSEKIAQELGKCVELKDHQYLIPRLD
jgi:hypothetical protein